MKIILLFLLCIVSAMAQTRQDLQKTYGKPVSESYEIRPDILANFTYSKEGTLCKLTITPKQTELKFDQEKFDFLTQLIDEVLPIRQRGRSIINGFYSGVSIYGTFYDYEKLRISRLIDENKKISVISVWKDESCGNNFREFKFKDKLENKNSL